MAAVANQDLTVKKLPGDASTQPVTQPMAAGGSAGTAGAGTPAAGVGTGNSAGVGSNASAFDARQAYTDGLNGGSYAAGAGNGRVSTMLGTPGTAAPTTALGTPGTAAVTPYAAGTGNAAQAQGGVNSRTVPEGFTGSTSIYGNGLTQDSQALYDRMNANSKAWWTADDAERERLHSENEDIARALGTYGVTGLAFDPEQGTWSGSVLSENSRVTPYEAAQLTGPTDLSDRVNAQYDASGRAAALAYKNAYDQSMLQLDAAAAKIPQQYRSAMNAAAGQAAQQQANFNEYAAAQGLNSGAAGQAALSRSNTLQNNLSSLQQAQAQALADVELQRASAQTQYQNAVAEALANNDLARAQALYQEWMRVDEGTMQTALNQANQNYLANQSRMSADSDYITRQMQINDRNYSRAWNQDERDYTRAWNEEDRGYTRNRDEQQQAFENSWYAALAAAQYGDVSGLQALGYNPNLMNQYLAAMANKGQYVGDYGAYNPYALGGGYSGTGYTGNGGYTPTPAVPTAEPYATGYEGQIVKPSAQAYYNAFWNEADPYSKVILQAEQ